MTFDNNISNNMNKSKEQTALVPVNWCRRCNKFCHETGTCFMNPTTIETFIIEYINKVDQKYTDYRAYPSFTTLLYKYMFHVHEESLYKMPGFTWLNDANCCSLKNVLQNLIKQQKIKLIPFVEEHVNRYAEMKDCWKKAIEWFVFCKNDKQEIINNFKLEPVDWCELCNSFYHKSEFCLMNSKIIETFMLDHFNGNLDEPYYASFCTLFDKYINYYKQNYNKKLKIIEYADQDPVICYLVGHVLYNLVSQNKLKLVPLETKSGSPLSILSVTFCTYDINMKECTSVNIDWCGICNKIYHKTEDCFMNEKIIEEFMIKELDKKNNYKSYDDLVQKYTYYINYQFPNKNSSLIDQPNAFCYLDNTCGNSLNKKSIYIDQKVALACAVKNVLRNLVEQRQIALFKVNDQSASPSFMFCKCENNNENLVLEPNNKKQKI